MASQSLASRTDQLKLALALIALLVAGALIAWNFGVFDSLLRGKPADPMANMTPEEHQQIQRQQKDAEERAKITPPS